MGKYVVRSGGTNAINGIYALPLTKNLNDYSSYERITEYSGTTEQTISAENGLLLYKNSIILDKNFIFDVYNNNFIIDCDFCFKNDLVQDANTKILFKYGSIQLRINTNKNIYIYDSAKNSTISTTFLAYGDIIWHHLTIFIDLRTKTFIFYIDEGLEILKHTSTTEFTTPIYFGDDTNGFNGFIKNLIITTKINLSIKTNILYSPDYIASIAYGDMEFTLLQDTQSQFNDYIALRSFKIYAKGVNSTYKKCSFQIPKSNLYSGYQMYYLIESESGYDYGSILLNGTELIRASGWNRGILPLSFKDGNNTIQMTISTDGSNHVGEDGTVCYGIGVVQLIRTPIIEPDEDIILYNLECKLNLTDISGYYNPTTYTGTTQKTINVSNGLYLYKNQIALHKNFLNFLTNNCFSISFNFQFNTTGTEDNLAKRRLFSFSPIFIDIAEKDNTSTNQLKLYELNNETNFQISKNKYNDMLWHYAKIDILLDSKKCTLTIDNTETLSITVSQIFTEELIFGNDIYGLNGYIKNIIITTPKI